MTPTSTHCAFFVQGRKAATLYGLHRWSEAIQSYDELLHHFGDAEETVGAAEIGAALIGKEFALKEVGRIEDARACLAEIVRRYANSPDPLLKKLAEESQTKLG